MCSGNLNHLKLDKAIYKLLATGTYIYAEHMNMYKPMNFPDSRRLLAPITYIGCLKK
jgi:hypothetical protein